MRNGSLQVLLILRTLLIRDGHPSPKGRVPLSPRAIIPKDLDLENVGGPCPQISLDLPNATHQSLVPPPPKDIAGICLSSTPISFLMLKEDQGRCPLPSTPVPN